MMAIQRSKKACTSLEPSRSQMACKWAGSSHEAKPLASSLKVSPSACTRLAADNASRFDVQARLATAARAEIHSVWGVVAVAVQLNHSGDEILDGVSYVGDPGEVAQYCWLAEMWSGRSGDPARL